MFKNIKQKLSTFKNPYSKKHILAIFCLVLFFTFFYSHGVNASEFQWSSPITSTVILLLETVLSFVTVLLSGAETLFTWIIDPDNMKAIMDNDAIYTTWRTVRDVFNIAFIMVLLFSAFCTIFQVSKYGIKTIWLNLVLMALLVNFSYPIARFIIDASNMLMYGLLNNLGGATSFTTLLQKSGLSGIIGAKNPEPLYLLSMVVFTFIFAITLLTIAILLVIRTVTLAIYIIFSPIAFTGSILPGTAMAEAGNKWWTDFMKQCFAGPIIVFMLYIATTMMSAVTAAGGSIDAIAASQVPGGNAISETLKKLIRDISFLSMPIIILWIGIFKAQESGIAGAKAVVGYGKTAGKWLAKNPALGSVGWTFKKSGIPEGAKQSWNKNVTQRFDRYQKNRDAKWASRLGDKSAGERNMKSRAAQYEKDNESVSDLKAWASKGDAAAAYALANTGKIDQKTFSESMANIKDEKMRESILGKAEGTRMDVTLKYKLEMDMKKATTDPTKKNWTNIGDVAKDEYANLTAEAWSKQKNLKEQFTPGIHNPNATEIEAGAKAAFKELLEPARIEAIKRMRGGDVTAVTK